MATFIVGLVFILGLADYSDASYCLCNSGLSDSVLQKSIDYACGAGADCSPILQNGPCFNPNTVKDHCNYAVNSYYQRKGNAPDSCDFEGTASVSPNSPSVASGCVFPSGPSNAGTTNPPTTLSPPASPITGGGAATTPATFPGGTTTPGVVPGSPLTPGFGLAPTGTGGNFGSTYSAAKPLGSSQTTTILLVSVVSISCLFLIERPRFVQH